MLPSRAALGSRLCCWALLCILGAGSMGSEVTQTPRHLIKTRGQQVTLSCSPLSEHLYVYWYQQARGQGPQFLFRYYREQQQEKGDIPDRFSGRQFSDHHSELNLSTLELGDSAVFLCASSLTQPCTAPATLSTNPSAGSGSDGHTDAGVTQTPRHKFTMTGGNVTLQYTQDMNHEYRYWYQQDLGLWLWLIHYSIDIGDVKGDIPYGYSVSRSNTEHFPFTLRLAAPSQTAVYFGTSSVSAALHGHLSPLQKGLRRLPQPTDPGVLRAEVTGTVASVPAEVHIQATQSAWTL